MEQPTGWTVVVPVKGIAQAKRRLAPDVGLWRAALAGAFAADVVDAALGVPGVVRLLLIGGEGMDPVTLTRPGLLQLPDVGGIDAAVLLGTTRARADAPRGHVLMLQGDLPCVRSADLTDLIAAAPGSRPGVLADADGLGTVALVMPPGTDIASSFGPGSLQRHIDAGADPIDLPVARLRRDVDTLEHLHAAVGLGVGRHTQQVLEQMRFPGLRDLTA